MITSFWNSGLVDVVVLTIAPLLLGGLRAVATLAAPLALPGLTMEPAGPDWIAWGPVRQPQPAASLSVSADRN